MLYEMRSWQLELGRLARTLSRHVQQTRWSDRSNASVEKCLVLGFYTIRKMLDAFQPPPDLPSAVQALRFPRRDAKLPPITWPDVAEAFDLGRPNRCKVPLRDLCNQVVHSYFLSTWLSADRQLKGVFVSSDWEKERYVYRVDVADIIRLFQVIATSRRKVVSLAHFYPDHNWVLM